LWVALLPVLTDLTDLARQTLTWDQGSEVVCHHRLKKYLADGIFFAFFAPPASPWLRGTNENINGLLRQYFPKGAATCAPSRSPICERSDSASTAVLESDLPGVAQPASWRPSSQG